MMVVIWQKIAVWAMFGFVALFFIVLVGTVYIAAKDLWKTYVDDKKGGKYDGK